MVDAEKAKQPKVKKNKNSNLPDINLKSLIFGAAAYAFFPLVATQYGIDLLMAFSAIGPLDIGYEAKSYLKALILGIVGATPLLYMAFAGFLGAYLYQGRAKAKEEYEIAKGTKGTKNVPVKPKEKKFEDTGNVKKNIANLFLPKGRRKK